jgi:hypothetical protein
MRKGGVKFRLRVDYLKKEMRGKRRFLASNRKISSFILAAGAGDLIFSPG